MLNHDPETKSLLNFPDDVFLVDSTIRSLQSSVSGSRHTATDLVDIAMAVDDLGVREILINTSWRDGLETVAGLKQRRPKAKIVATYRCKNERGPELLRASLDAGADEICFESPTGVEQIRADTATAAEAGATVSTAFAEKHTWDEMVELSHASIEVGAKSLSFHDSFFRFGVTPEAMKVFIGRIRGLLPGHPPLYIHLSNFYGTAAMTAVSGISAGANAVDVCLNTTGHHCGHISLAEVALILEDLYGVSTGIKLDHITDAVALVGERTGVPVKLQQPLIGDLAFMIDGADWAAEADLPYDDRMHSRLPVEPDVVGSSQTMIWTDRTTTPRLIGVKLKSLGLRHDEAAAAEAHALLRSALEESSDFPQFLTDEAFSDLLRGAYADR